jgi:hypothetical protein
MKKIGILLAVMLTARMGVYHNAATGFTETWYNLPMDKVVERAVANGYDNDYWERADGAKMLGRFVILAADESIPLGTVIECSRGTGIVLDRTTTNDPNIIDLAVTWK